MNQLEEFVEGVVCGFPSGKFASDLRYRWYRGRLARTGGPFFSCEGLRIVNPHRVFIGREDYFARNDYLLAVDSLESSITIGDGCYFGMNVCIVAGDHDYRGGLTGRNSLGGHIVIGNRVWVGANAVVLKNVRIGDRAVVGAGAVVTHDVLPGVIVGGVPARRIKWGGVETA